MIKDGVGNELQVGDLIAVHVNRIIILKIAKIEEPGSLITSKNGKDQMGRITSIWVTNDQFAKDQEYFMQFFKITNPASQSLIEKISGDEPKPPTPFISFRKQ